MNIRSLLLQPLLTVVFHEREVRWTIGRGGRIAASGRAVLPPGMVDDGVILDSVAAGICLRETADFPGGRRMQVISALPAQRTVFRQLELPVLAKKQFAELVQREVRREMPMIADNAYVSWATVAERDVRRTVFVVGVARDVLDSHLAALRAAGLRPQAVDLRLVAAARAVGETDVIIANVEDDEVELGIFRHGVPAIVRFVPMSAPCGEPAWSAQIGEELARTLKFYRDSHRDDQVVDRLPIVLVGGASRQAARGEDVRAATGHDVLVPELLRDVVTTGNPAAFAANVGLVLKAAA